MHVYYLYQIFIIYMMALFYFEVKKKSRSQVYDQVLLKIKFFSLHNHLKVNSRLPHLTNKEPGSEFQ